MMEQWPDYQQILTLSMPAIEFVAPAEQSPDLARLANDGMAEICAKHPKQFPGWVASVPMNNVKASLAEIERAVEKIGARGIQIFTNVYGRPLDDPEFAPIFARLARLRSADLDAPDAAAHPFATIRARTSPNSTSGGCSAGPMKPAPRWRAWCSPAFSTDGPTSRSSPIISARWCRILEARVGLGLDQLGTREGAEPGYAEIIKAMKAKGNRPVDYFRHVLWRHRDQRLASGTRCGIDFFGCEHVLFGTDCPSIPKADRCSSATSPRCSSISACPTKTSRRFTKAMPSGC